MNPAQLLAHFDRISEAPDAIARLRRFILDLAVRGKLVEQNPKDEPASELLKRIQAEKERLVKEGILRKQEPPPAIEEEGTNFALPKGWLWVRMADVIKLWNGYAFKSADFQPNGAPVIRIGDLQGGEVVLSGVVYISDTIANSVGSEVWIPPGGLLIAMSGATTGKVAVNRTGRRLLLNQRVGRIEVFLANTNFIRLFFETIVARNLSISFGTAIPNLSAKQINETIVPLPPLAEQDRIIAKVSQLMAVCDRLEGAQAEREGQRDRLVAASLHGLNNSSDAQSFREHSRFHLSQLPRLTTRPEHVQQLRQSILNLAVRGQLVPQDPNDEPATELMKRIDVWRREGVAKKTLRLPRKPLSHIQDSESPYSLPGGWSWARLGQIIYIHSGDGLTAEAMEGGTVPVFGGNGINGYHDTANVFQPTVVIGRVGYYCGSIHVTPPKAWVTDNAFITEFCSEAIFQKFLVLLLKATNLKENEGATAQPVISGSKIYSIVIGLPPLPEQHRIVAKVQELMALCDRLEAQLTMTQTESRRLLEAVLHQALAPADV